MNDIAELKKRAKKLKLRLMGSRERYHLINEDDTGIFLVSLAQVDWVISNIERAYDDQSTR